MRLGEVMGCIHATEEPDEFGRSKSCRECGAINAILRSQECGLDQQECRITGRNNVVYDFNIWAKSIVVKKNKFTVVSINDISNEKRRQVLERIFFHDILNTAGNLRSFLTLMKESDEEEKDEFINLALDVSNNLIDELKAQRMLSLAENYKLEVDVSEFLLSEIAEEVIKTYRNNYLGENKEIEFVNMIKKNKKLRTDKTLLRRVLGNLLKNALEASKDGDKVTITTEEMKSQIVFNIHNKSFIPKNVELQIFQRSFSTKGPGRGVGTYSVKLLTERYLKGEVSFITDQKLGTIFTVIIPEKLEEN